jgi:hypothetical protein
MPDDPMTLDPNFLSLFLYAMVLWDKGVDYLTPKTYLPEDHEDMRCQDCKLFGCEHMRKATPRMGEAFGDKPAKGDTKLSTPMPRANPRISYPIRVEDSKVRIATEPKTMPTRVLVPPTVKFPSNGTVSINGDLPGNVKLSTVVRTPEVKAEETPASDSVEVLCSICQKKMDVSHITMHLKVHMDEYNPIDRRQGAALANIGKPTTPIPILPSSHIDREATTVRLSSKEQYQPRRISHISFSSSVGRNGRYSDFSLMLWEPVKKGMNDHTYAHGAYSASYSDDVRRLHIMITYDALEDYYHLGARLYRKLWYNETHEESIPERICENERELYMEIRRALIYFRINPRSVYRLFRKMQMRDNFVLEHDKEGRVIGTATSNTEALMEQLKNTKETTSQYNGYS